MFGTEPKVGLASSSVSTEIIEHLESEDDLLRALSIPPNDVSPPLSDVQLPASLPPPLSTSPLGLRHCSILSKSKRARECLTDQAERMVKRSRIELQAVNRGQVPMAGDPRNILGVVIDKNENDLCTIATRHGMLSNKYFCRQQLLKDSSINKDKCFPS